MSLIVPGRWVWDFFFVQDGRDPLMFGLQASRVSGPFWANQKSHTHLPGTINDINHLSIPICRLSWRSFRARPNGAHPPDVGIPNHGLSLPCFCFPRGTLTLLQSANPLSKKPGPSSLRSLETMTITQVFPGIKNCDAHFLRKTTGT